MSPKSLHFSLRYITIHNNFDWGPIVSKFTKFSNNWYQVFTLGVKFYL